MSQFLLTSSASSFNVTLNPEVDLRAGDSLQPEDFNIKYTDEFNQLVDVDFNQVYLSGFDSSTPGTKYVVVSYDGNSQVVPVLVKPNNTNLTVTPAKQSYTAGTELTTTDFIVYAGADRIYSFDISPNIFQNSGQHTVTILYSGMQAQTVVKVIEPVQQTTQQEGFTISLSGEYKTEYYVGEQIDTSGVKVTKVTNSGKVSDVTKECKFNVPSTEVEGEFAVEVTYKSQVLTYPVKIIPVEYLNMEFNQDGTVTIHYTGKDDEVVSPTQVTSNGDGTYKVTAISENGSVYTENIINYYELNSIHQEKTEQPQGKKSQRIAALVPVGITIAVSNGTMAPFEETNIQSVSDVAIKVTSTPQEEIAGLGEISYIVDANGDTVLNIDNEPVKSPAYYAAVNSIVEVYYDK